MGSGDVAVQIKFNKELLEKVKKYADAYEHSVSSFVRFACKTLIKELERQEDGSV